MIAATNYLKMILQEGSELETRTYATAMEKLYQENDVVKVGEVIAIIEDIEQLENTDTNTTQKKTKSNPHARR